MQYSMSNNISIKVTDNEDECIESQYLLSPLSPTKSHTLVLDIDETLLSVRRWVDETQINDRVLYTNKIFKIIKITKEVTLQYDDGVVNVYSFYFNQQQPFGQLNSSLDIGDRMDIGARLASVKEVFTSYITICDEENNTATVEVNCLNDGYLQSLQYVANERDNKFTEPDLVYNNTYLVRFRSGLCNFFSTLSEYENLEIILWTAAVRKVYTPLMIKVEQMLLSEMNKNNERSAKTNLWQNVLFRDNCSVRENGSFFKDLSLLNRDYSDLMMVDNISFNFEGFEYNGLPINEYWGHQNDQQLHKLLSILRDILCSPNEDIRGSFHRLAFLYEFSTFKLEQMLKYIKPHIPSPSPPPPQHASASDTEAELITDINMDFPQSSESNNYDASDSSPTSSSSASSSSSSSYSNSNGNNTDAERDEDSDQNLDFYLFNFSPDIFDDDEDIDGDDGIFDDVDPTLLFNQNYN